MRAVVACILLALVLTVGTMALAEPAIDIYADAATYQSGDSIEVSLSAENDDEGMSVDVYVGILLPDGDIWSTQYDGWSHSIEPWIPDIYVPASFEMAPAVFWTLDLPCGAPPINAAGDYAFAAVLMSPGTSDWVCNATLAPFIYSTGWPSTDITMLSIPAGSFLIGSPSDESGRDSDEGPQRTVNISAFEMSETEVTGKQFEDVMGWNDSHFSGDDHPVEEVTWFDCVSFCNKLSKANGYSKCYTITYIAYDGNHITSADVSCSFDANGYRLPTEAEWEYACRAGTTTRFNTGDSDSDLGRAGWYDGNSGWTTHTVSEKKRNAWGLYDMHGNVWEWCWDWYSPVYYGTRPDLDSNPMGPVSGSLRVIRGGGWYSDAQNCRSAKRYFDYPRGFYFSIGFRVCRSR
ncbi:formylglycine-generating enzyme family protein [bacterium]|nr:formylglycine-generating enzyme family protein [bacterium]